MPSQHEDLIRRAYGLINAGDSDSARELAHDDFQLTSLFTSIAGRTYRGQAGLDEWLNDVEESWSSIRQDVEQVIEIDAHRAVAIVTLHAVGRGSGVEIAQGIAVLFTIRNGKFSRLEAFATLEEAQAAAAA